jgi:hypothetical protein
MEDLAMTITEIKQSNKEAGYHFFDRSTMRFFDSRVERGVYSGPGGVFFVTSEQFHGSGGYVAPRKFTVRKFDPTNGDVDTFGQFNEIKSLEDAREIARKSAKG